MICRPFSLSKKSILPAYANKFIFFVKLYSLRTGRLCADECAFISQGCIKSGR